jgi:hypothetical protein
MARLHAIFAGVDDLTSRRHGGAAAMLVRLPRLSPWSDATAGNLEG